jgi:hypothetical protein
MSTENQIQEGAIGEEEEEERRPLIDSSILIVHQNGDDTIFPVPNQRLVSLDVFRGLTVAVRPLFSTIFPFYSIAPCL